MPPDCSMRVRARVWRNAPQTCPTCPNVPHAMAQARCVCLLDFLVIKKSIRKKMKNQNQHFCDDPAGPTAERAARGKFERVIPDGLLAGGGRRVWRDLHADAVLRMHADQVIGDIELAAAIRFAELARRAMGPVRLARSGMVDRVDGAGADDEAITARALQARKEWRAVKAALRAGERRVLIEILYFEHTLGQAAVKMFGARWAGANARNAAANVLLQSALEGLVRHWGLKGG